MMAAGGVAHERMLQPGEKIRVSSGKIAYYDQGVDFSIERVGGLGAMVFGGEGLTVATLTNTTNEPLKVCTQSTTVRDMAMEMMRFVPAASNHQQQGLLEMLR
jgi:uncharacterized protein (AIM24 family)